MYFPMIFALIYELACISTTKQLLSKQINLNLQKNEVFLQPVPLDFAGRFAEILDQFIVNGHCADMFRNTYLLVTLLHQMVNKVNIFHVYMQYSWFVTDL